MQAGADPDVVNLRGESAADVFWDNLSSSGTKLGLVDDLKTLMRPYLEAALARKKEVKNARKKSFHSLTHPLTHSPTHSLTHSSTHSLTHSLTHPLTHSPTHPLTHSPH